MATVIGDTFIPGGAMTDDEREIVRLCEQLVSLLRDNREPGLLTWQMFRGQQAEALYKKLGEVLYGGA